MDEEIIYTFNAKIENIKYYSDETNYHIMTFSTTDNIPQLQQKYFGKVGTMVGYCVKCIEGDRCQVKATLTNHPKWGYQYVIKSLTYDKPMDEKSLYNFLSAIISEAQAIVLYNAYPDIIDRVMQNNDFEPDYKILHGIGPKNWIGIRDKIIDNLGYAELISLLAPVGCTLHMIKKIGQGETNPSLLKQKILQNPYILCDIPNMGFKKVDGFAIKIKPDIIDSEMRIKACLNYILDMQENDGGQSFMSEEDLKKEFKRVIYDDGPYRRLKDFLSKEKEIFEKNPKDAFLYIKDNNIGLIKTYFMEQYIFDKLRELSMSDNIWDISYKYFFKQMDITFKKQGFHLSEEQMDAVRSIAENNVSIISGKAGCVDCDTEYFNGTEWVRIADYKQGDKVLQYNIDTKEATLAYPEYYHKYPCEQLWHFEDQDNNIDQVLCDEHNILICNGKKIQVKDWLKNRKIILLPSCFYYSDSNKFKNVVIQYYIDKNIQCVPYKTKDGYKYCFTMPLGTLILRRNNKIFITGNCGKTSVIKAILEVYKNHNICMAALSAKAAKRMREVTGFLNAMTIHRLLGYILGKGFTYDEREPLPYDLIILDECSMNNVYLFYSILKATHKNAKIILSGDYAQLPSIGVGSVFSDLVKYPYFNNHNLTKIYRQSDKSFIVEHANVIREGIMPFDNLQGNMMFGDDTLYLFRNTSEQIRDNAVNLYLEFLKKTDIKDITIVCPRKDTVCVSCESMNNIIQNTLLPNAPMIELNSKQFKKGCRVINKKNDYDKGVLNGDLGTVISINEKGSAFEVLFDEGHIAEFKRSEMVNLELGYAISVHSSQGSQYNVCIVAMDMSSYVLLSSNMIYTAMTRAIKTLIVISQPNSFNKAVKNVEENNRNTYLKLMLEEYDEKELYDSKKNMVHTHHPIVQEDGTIITKENEWTKESEPEEWIYSNEISPF